MIRIGLWMGAVLLVSVMLTVWQGKQGAFRGFVLAFALPLLLAVFDIARGWFDVRYDLKYGLAFVPIWALGWSVWGIAAAVIGLSIGFLGRSVKSRYFSN